MRNLEGSVVLRRVGDMDSPAVWVEDDFLGSEICIEQPSEFPLAFPRKSNYYL